MTKKTVFEQLLLLWLGCLVGRHRQKIANQTGGNPKKTHSQYSTECFNLMSDYDLRIPYFSSTLIFYLY
jgi:hypothetical protein